MGTWWAPFSVSSLCISHLLPSTPAAVGPAVQVAFRADLHRALADHLGLSFPRFCPAVCRATYPACCLQPGWECAGRAVARMGGLQAGWQGWKGHEGGWGGSCVPATSLTRAQTRPCCSFRPCSRHSFPRLSTHCWAALSSSCPTPGPSSSGSVTTSESPGLERRRIPCGTLRGTGGERVEWGRLPGDQMEIGGWAVGNGTVGFTEVADPQEHSLSQTEAWGSHPGLPGCVVLLGESLHIREP